ncbi:uncharacterized protein MEPE_03984 [Melanopsichium pennsylvanicum]|uniref:Secreted protein n=1 Tax=Melanopsichium pennsylvanicum TaxID=63383 RepID=A0AAJ5C5Z4_9BASI|nr:uncharacterized protein MEPE_03984 [Melanopsichium pennsylvanicum]
MWVAQVAWEMWRYLVQLAMAPPLIGSSSVPTNWSPKRGCLAPSRLSDRRDWAPTDPLRTPCSGAVGLTRSSYRPTAAGPSVRRIRPSAT